MNASELYAYRKSHGLCVSCGDERAVMGKVRCVRCAQIHSVKQQMYHPTEEQKERKRKYLRDYQHSHHEKYREYQRRYREKEAMYEW